MTRLAENERVLIDVCDLLTSAVTANRRIMPAAEWLLDNFYLIEEQIRTAKRHLPKGYSRELPRLAHGPSAKLPRVYDIAFEAISHGDGRVDADTLSRFVAAYQTVTPLKVGELWAIPIMLRLAMIENLRRVGARIAAGTLERNQAAEWADQMMEIADRDPKNLILVIADMARSSPPMVSSFVAELARRLQGHSAALALPLTWIEQCLSESGLSIEQLVHAETQEQAGVQVSISNTIGSLRFLGAMDWREFVESMSVVEAKLREDPGGLYGRMDFATRDRYRHVVEEIAKGSHLSESEVARKAIQLAYEGAARHRQERRRRSRSARRVLPDRQGSAAPRTRGRDAPFAVRGAARSRAPRPACCSTSARSWRSPSVSPRSCWQRRRPTASPASWASFSGSCCCLAVSQLAVGMVNWLSTLLVTPAPVAADGFFQGAAAAVAHAGGGPDAAHQRSRTSKAWSRRWRSDSSPIGMPTSISAC